MQPSDASDTGAAVISLTEAAAILGIHRSTAYDHARKGTFPVPVLRVGSLLKVNRSHLDAYLSGSYQSVG